MRKLAEICSIKSADTIFYNNQEYTKVRKYSLNENAYEFVAQAGFNIGDKVVFIGEGAMIPATNTDFEFLRTKCYSAKYNMFRVKPQKMCGFISMGILMPISILKKDYKIGTEVTSLLNIGKFEDFEEASPKKTNWFKGFMFKHFKPLAKLIWKIKGDIREEFPTWLISKTDEDNIENRLDDLEKHANEPFYVTAKMEGQSGTFVLDKKNKFYVCSRNCAYTSPVDNNYWTVAKKYLIEDILRKYHKATGEHLIIQGEICGPSIQQNIYKFNTLQLFVFNVKCIETGKYLPADELVTFCSSNNLDMVPVVDAGERLLTFVTKDNIAEIRDSYVEKLAFKPSSNNKPVQIIDPYMLEEKIDNKNIFHCEGIVIRTFDSKFSCKFKSPSYALWFSGKEK